MTEAQAIKELETKYASLEDFALQLFVHPQREHIMGDTWSWQKKADQLRLSTAATTVILALSKRFQRTMKELTVSSNWNFEAQDRANKQFVKDTVNVTEKPSERVKVAQYLNREAGISQEETEKQGGLVINLTFNGQSMADMLTRIQGEQQGEYPTITLDPNGRPVQPHLPNISGSSVPDGVTRLESGQRARIDTTDSLLPEAVPRSGVGGSLTGTSRPAADVKTSVSESATAEARGFYAKKLAERLID